MSPKNDSQTSLSALKLHMIGRGDSATRMAKRLRCAARSLGVPLELSWQADQYGEPEVFYAGRRMVQGLLRTEELEPLLTQLLTHSAEQEKNEEPLHE